MRWIQLMGGIINLSCVFAHINDYIVVPGLKIPREYHTRVLEIDTFTDFLWANLHIGLFYVFVYLGVGGALEYTNPAPKTEKRQQQTKKQILLGLPYLQICIGLQSLFWVIVGTTVWMYAIEPHGPYYGYYSKHSFGVRELVTSFIVYVIFFDAWFYVTHIILHRPFLWKLVHKYHHEFIEPSAFSQDAVHPIEAILQGPLGHFLPALFFPMHPVWWNVFGFLTGLYALFAHDARWDPVGHINHHYYINCNFGLWGFLDHLCGTKFNKTNFPVEYVPTWMRKKIE